MLGQESSRPLPDEERVAPPRRRRRLALALVLLGAWPAAAGADEGWPAWYVMPRVGTAVLVDSALATGVETTSTQQATGLSIGADLSRHLGVELAGDAFEPNLRAGVRTVGEYGLFTLVPQVRARFPLPGTPLTPYALAGVGVSFAEFNDRKKVGIGRRVRANDTGVVAALGGGIEYAVGRDVAVGVEVRYLSAHGHDVRIDEHGGEVALDTVVVGGTLRLRLEPEPAGARMEGADSDRFLYLALRAGGATATRARIARGLEAHPENAALAGRLNLLFGVGVGADLGRHVGVEIAADGHEYNVAVPGVGTVAEYAVYTVVPQVRVRYPLLDDRLVPYALGGIGVSYGELNDIKPRGIDLDLDGVDYGAVGAVGVGVEWFLSRAIAVGLEGKYQHFLGGNHLRLVGQSRDSRPHALLATAGFRVYFGSRPW